MTFTLIGMECQAQNYDRLWYKIHLTGNHRPPEHQTTAQGSSTVQLAACSHPPTCQIHCLWFAWTLSHLVCIMLFELFMQLFHNKIWPQHASLSSHCSLHYNSHGPCRNLRSWAQLSIFKRCDLVVNWYWNWGLRFLMSASSWANKLTSASNVSCNCAQSKVCNLGRRPNVAWQKGKSKVRQHDPITMTRTQNEGKQLQMPCVLVSQNLGPSVKKSLPRIRHKLRTETTRRKGVWISAACFAM